MINTRDLSVADANRLLFQMLLTIEESSTPKKGVYVDHRGFTTTGSA